MANRQKRRLAAERIAAKEAQLQQVFQLSNRKKRLKKKPLKTLNHLKKVNFKYCKLSKVEQTDLALIFDNFAQNNKQRNHCPIDTIYHFLRCLIKKNVLHLLTKGDWDEKEALRIVLEHRREWVRPIEEWKTPKTKHKDALFAHLVRHLFAKYYVPLFLDEAWWGKHAGNHSGYNKPNQSRPQNEYFIHWFLHIAKGNNIRTAQQLPFPLTKKMAHYFLQSHEHVYITEAFRRAQVLAMGGSKRQAKLIIRTRLGGNLEHNDFWEQVVRFLLRYPELKLREIKQIVDFIHFQKYETPWIEDLQGEKLDFPPIQPNWQIKGKTLASVRREMQRWQQIPNDYLQAVENLTWKPFPIADFEVKKEDGTIYRIQQITQLHQLYREGIAMNHCVGTYCQACKNGETSIWSLWYEKSDGNCKRLVTIEVNQYRKLQQMYQKNNEEPSKLEKSIIREWAKKEKIRVLNE